MQNAVATSAYAERVETGGLAGHKGYVITPTDAAIAAMIEELMCFGTLHADRLCQAHPAMATEISAAIGQVHADFPDVTRLDDGGPNTAAGLHRAGARHRRHARPDDHTQRRAQRRRLTRGPPWRVRFPLPQPGGVRRRPDRSVAYTGAHDRRHPAGEIRQMGLRIRTSPPPSRAGQRSAPGHHTVSLSRAGHPPWALRQPRCLAALRAAFHPSGGEVDLGRPIARIATGACRFCRSAAPVTALGRPARRRRIM